MSNIIIKYYDKRFMKLLSLEILNTRNSNSGNPVQCYIKTILTLTVRETHMREDNRKHTMGPKPL